MNRTKSFINMELDQYIRLVSAVQQLEAGKLALPDSVEGIDPIYQRTVGYLMVDVLNNRMKLSQEAHMILCEAAREGSSKGKIRFTSTEIGSYTYYRCEASGKRFEPDNMTPDQYSRLVSAVRQLEAANLARPDSVEGVDLAYQLTDLGYLMVDVLNI